MCRFNFGDWYGIDRIVHGYAPSIPNNVLPGGSALLFVDGRFSAAAYTVSRKPVFPDQKEIFRSSTGVAVYQNPDVMPRVWTSSPKPSKLKIRPDARRQLYRTLHSTSERRLFSYAAPPALDPCEGDDVQSSSRGINWSTATVSMKCRGMVITSENNAPGWIARVDNGRETILSMTLIRRCRGVRYRGSGHAHYRGCEIPPDERDLRSHRDHSSPSSAAFVLWLFRITGQSPRESPPARESSPTAVLDKQLLPRADWREQSASFHPFCVGTFLIMRILTGPLRIAHPPNHARNDGTAYLLCARPAGPARAANSPECCAQSSSLPCAVRSQKRHDRIVLRPGQSSYFIY